MNSYVPDDSDNHMHTMEANINFPSGHAHEFIHAIFETLDYLVLSYLELLAMSGRQIINYVRCDWRPAKLAYGMGHAKKELPLPVLPTLPVPALRLPDRNIHTTCADNEFDLRIWIWICISTKELGYDFPQKTS